MNKTSSVLPPWPGDQAGPEWAAQASLEGWIGEAQRRGTAVMGGKGKGHCPRARIYLLGREDGHLHQGGTTAGLPYTKFTLSGVSVLLGKIM